MGFSTRADAAADTVAGPITCVVLLVLECLSLGLEIALKLAPVIPSSANCIKLLVDVPAQALKMALALGLRIVLALTIALALKLT